jgi:serine protease Do
MKIKTLFVVFCIAYGLPFSGIAQTADTLRGTAQDFTEVAEIAIPAVVSVQVKSKPTKNSSGPFDYDPSFEFFQDDFFGRFFGIPRKDKLPNQFQLSQGSGFLISPDGYILTNSHVVKDSFNLTVKLNDGREFPGKVIGDDDSTDVALIKIDAKDLPYLKLGNSDNLRVGQWVVAIGNTLGLQASLTVGVVSAKGRSNLDLARIEDFIQTDAAINRGNSGGPLLNLKGEVIGINTAIATNISSGYMGIGFAIPSNMAKYVMEQLQAKGSFTRGYLGVVLQEITSDLAQAFNLKKVEGALIADVQPDSPAAKAGLRQGDIILQVNRQNVENIGFLRNLVALQKPGTKMTFSILRDKKPLEIEVEVGSMKGSEDKDGEHEEATSNNTLGLEVQTLTSELRKSLGLEEASGVLISKVLSGSPAESAGLKKGSLILAVNQQQITSKQQFDQLVKNLSDENLILLLVKQGNAIGFVPLRLGQNVNEEVLH